MKYLKKKLEGRIPYYSAMIEEGVILNANESSFFTPLQVNEDLKKYLLTNDFRRYPDTDATKLEEAIAAKYGVKKENVVCGVGSDQILDMIFRSMIDNDYVLLANPTFSMYKEYGFYSDAKILEVPFKSDFSFDQEAIIDKIYRFNPKLTIICTPNNPTGSTLSRQTMIEIIKSTKNLVVIDEAYGEFNDDSFVDLATKYDNVIVLKTFSKAYALAGMRVGYAISCKDVIDTINVVKPPYNLSCLTQEAATFVIKNTNLYKDSIKSIIENRGILYRELLDLGIEVYPSKANFLWTKMPPYINKELLEKKIYIRQLIYNNEEYYRITVGSTEENNILLEAIKEALKCEKVK